MGVRRGLGRAWGVDGGWPPLPIRPQRDYDPVSLVKCVEVNSVQQQCTVPSMDLVAYE